jgi:hypothetical protein
VKGTQTLFDWLKNNQNDQKHKVLQQIYMAALNLHENKIPFTNLHPKNIFINKNNDIQLGPIGFWCDDWNDGLL